MKEKEIEKIEELRQEEKLPKEKKQELKRTVFNTIMECISVIELLVVLMVIAYIPNEQVTLIIYKVSSMAILLFSIFLFEKAYKKDDGMIAISGIEILVLSIIVLFAPYRILKKQKYFFTINFYIFCCLLYHKIYCNIFKSKQKI